LSSRYRYCPPGTDIVLQVQIFETTVSIGFQS
jgi:hypothetical protein